MSLWLHWWNAIRRLRPAFSRLQTFLWFATAVAGFTVRTDMLGVTSLIPSFPSGHKRIRWLWGRFRKESYERRRRHILANSPRRL